MTLDEEKTIDVAKIIKNEARLKSINDSLLDVINQQRIQIETLAENNLKNLDKLEVLNQAISNLSESYDRLSNWQLEYEKDKKQIPHIYGRINATYLSSQGGILPMVGALYVNKKFGIGVSGGIFNNKPAYGIDLMLSFF